ncbi:unnamed protein product [Lampetra planeri]
MLVTRVQWLHPPHGSRWCHRHASRRDAGVAGERRERNPPEPASSAPRTEGERTPPTAGRVALLWRPRECHTEPCAEGAGSCGPRSWLLTNLSPWLHVLSSKRNRQQWNRYLLTALWEQREQTQ